VRLRSCPSVTVLLLVLAGCSSPPPSPAVGAQPAKSVEAPKQEVALAASQARSDLPAELSSDALREVLEPVKVDARHTCKGLARSRERIEVELTIAGASGAVTHTNIGLNGGNPELASCVAKELARATFTPTRKAATRTTVAVNF
jgi:hypothetical protein